MKKMKKLVGILLTLAMVVVMSVTAFAADITINGTGNEYKAYKLLNATNDTTDQTKFAYTLNNKYASILKSVTGETDGAKIVKKISESADSIQSFADTVYNQVKELDADYTTTNKKFEGVDQGYYLIVETALAGDNDTYSLVMLDTVGSADLTVNTKEGVPTLEKKVQEKNDSTGTITGWQDGADYDIGDDVPFKLTGTVSDKYDNYKTYAYTFHDKMSAGLTFNNDVRVVVKVINNDGIETTIDASKYTVVTDGLTDGGTFEVRFADLKKIEQNGQKLVKSTSKITVEYTARLNEHATIGSDGNPNEARLEYSNNPYGDGKGTTPWDKVIVFAYKLVANKVDKDGNELAGAGFTLYKWNKSSANPNDKYEAVGAEIKGTKDEPKTTFEFSGLDAGQYKLVETTVPAGYNKAEDLIFTVEATYEPTEKSPDVPVLKDLVIKKENGEVISGENKVFTTSLTAGSATTNIVNHSGTELPSTGGMGTTILYVVGAILVIGAGILLVTKKRMNANK